MVVLYDGNKCMIFDQSTGCKNLKEDGDKYYRNFRMTGLNKYMVISAEGLPGSSSGEIGKYMNGLLILVGIILFGMCDCRFGSVYKNSGFISCNNHYYRIGGFSYHIITSKRILK